MKPSRKRRCAGPNGEPISPNDDAQIHFRRAIALHTLNRAAEAIAEFRTSVNEKDDNRRRARGHGLCIVAGEAVRRSASPLRQGVAAQGRVPRGAPHDGQHSRFPGRPRGSGGAFSQRVETLAGRSRYRGTNWRSCFGSKSNSATPSNNTSRCWPSQPKNLDVWLNVARLLISDPRPEARFGAEAREIAKHVCAATEQSRTSLPCRCSPPPAAEASDFDGAEAILRKAMELPARADAEPCGRFTEHYPSLSCPSEADYQVAITSRVQGICL